METVGVIVGSIFIAAFVVLVVLALVNSILALVSKVEDKLLEAKEMKTKDKKERPCAYCENPDSECSGCKNWNVRDFRLEKKRRTL